MPEPTLRRFLERLAAAAGVAAIPILGAADTGEPDPVCVSVTDATCPGAADALARFQDAKEWGAASECQVVAVLGAGELDTTATSCCYDVQLDCSSAERALGFERMNTGCMGRPYVEDGRVVTAMIGARAARWRGPHPNVDGLDPARLATLSQFWIGVALAEHASIAEFHRICLELMRFGAPLELIARAQVAAVDEARHSRRCFAVASAYAGRPLDAGALPIGATVELAPDLATLAATTARDGCVAETCSAWLYAGLRDRAQDPVVREVLAGVVRDETRHAELAWATLRWALAAGGAPARAAAAEAMRLPPPTPTLERLPDDTQLAAHGWAPYQVQERLTTEAWRRMVLPLAAQMGLDVVGDPLVA